jgi:plasmid stabilization system protein ParE
VRRYRVRFARAAQSDLERLAEFLVEQSPERAAEVEVAIRDAVEVLKRLPLVGRPALGQEDLTLRELLVPFGATGFVVLYRVGPGALVSVLAARHQLEEHFH